jgi:hypothetical protein
MSKKMFKGAKSGRRLRMSSTKATDESCPESRAAATSVNVMSSAILMAVGVPRRFGSVKVQTNMASKQKKVHFGGAQY